VKVALYARVSTKDQHNENQMNKLNEYATGKGYTIHDHYQDTVSGANKNRPELDRMVEDAKRRKFERVIAIKIDRLGRSLIHLCEFFDLMESYKVAIEITDQPIDTSSSMGRLIRNILGSIAEFERELISERTIAGLERTVKNGTKLGRKIRVLSDYQREKILTILEENPNISKRQLAEQFEGISRNTLIALAEAEGLFDFWEKEGSI